MYRTFVATLALAALPLAAVAAPQPAVPANPDQSGTQPTTIPVGRHGQITPQQPPAAPPADVQPAAAPVQPPMQMQPSMNAQTTPWKFAPRTATRHSVTAQRRATSKKNKKAHRSAM